MSLFLAHEGVKRKSGRWPWGSGEVPYQHEWWFSWGEKDNNFRAEGLSDSDIAKGMGISIAELREMRSIVKSETMALNTAEAWRLKEKGYSNVEIGRRMGVNESVVRSWLKKHDDVKYSQIKNTAEILKKNISDKSYIDIGSGTEIELGVSKSRKDAAVRVLLEQGYVKHIIKVPSMTDPKNYRTMMVLCPPGTEWKTVMQNKDRINYINEHSIDNGKTWFDIYPPQNIDSKRVLIRYGDEGGNTKDGVIEVRRGVEDLTMGNAKYAQVRIAVDGTHYLKGMAIYSDNIPKGYDIIFNTNKKSGTPKEDVFKKQNIDKKTGEVDVKDPFSAVLKEKVGQRHYIGKDGKEHLSAINIVQQEGDWGEYKKQIASQMLSKQELKVAKEQLSLAYKQKKAEYDEIMSLTNPEVKKKLLYSFADDCDAAAVHLKAAAFPRQTSRVILPLTDIKPTEVYAPGYKQGEKVVLIRYPHGGRFEIPELIVNNRNRDGIKTIGNAAKDAIGIHSDVAAKLSGADFDGDSVIIIPNNSGKIKSAPSLEGLKNYDPKVSYPAYPGMKKVSETSFDTQAEMGKITNLINDMTLKSAKPSEIARAVRHSMTIIDAEKHNLDWKTSFKDNRIAELKEKYQGGKTAGASTLISRAKSRADIPEVEQNRPSFWDPETGEKKIPETGKTHIKLVRDPATGKKVSTGEEVANTIKTTKMAVVKDAYELSSGTPMENAYADYANGLKALANNARKSYLNIKSTPASPTAKKTYAKEVERLLGALEVAKKNAPASRKANLVAYMQVQAKIRDNPDLHTKDGEKQIKKLRSRALAAASTRFGALTKDFKIEISPKEWEAIQSGAFSKSKLNEIFRYVDLDKLKKLATPKNTPALSAANIAAAKAMLKAGFDQDEVAKRFGVSVSTLNRYL